MMLALLVVSFGSANADAFGCDIFENHFLVHDGSFQDVCGATDVYGVNCYEQFSTVQAIDSTYLSHNIFAIDNTFNISKNGEYIQIPSPFITLDSPVWAIVFEGYDTRPPSDNSAFNMILAGAGNLENNQLRFGNQNDICVISHRSSSDKYMNDGECTVLNDDIGSMHTILLYYHNETLSIYQNGVFQGNISGNLHIAFGRIGCYKAAFLAYTEPADLAVKRLMFSSSSQEDLYSILSYSRVSSTIQWIV